MSDRVIPIKIFTNNYSYYYCSIKFKFIKMVFILINANQKLLKNSVLNCCSILSYLNLSICRACFSSSDESIDTILLLILSTERGSKKNADSPIISSNTLILEQQTFVPQAVASINGIPKPSRYEGVINTFFLI
ncbi:hypothetical protein P20652_3065 [Pseudoalteromonas sp. BSi20652]|nr:hypothetical protein P20652_3065 [Pseudoalteromonas sp. BSi20652]